MNLIDLKDKHPAGVLRLQSGVMFDLQNPRMEDIIFDDIAWSLGRQIRYNGHSPFAYTVARHSILMSYVVPQGYAMEALLHDAGEAYLSDVVNPLKRLLPEIERLEDKITAMVMTKFHVHNGDVYKKSKVVDKVDYQSYQYEQHLFRRPDGVFHESFAKAEEQAYVNNGLGLIQESAFPTDYDAFKSRFEQLTVTAAIAGVGK
jgi:hypothetical protein